MAKREAKDWYQAAIRRFGRFASAEEAYAKLAPRAFRNERQGRFYLYVGWVGDNRQAKVWLYRLVMAYGLGRVLRRDEHVHHIDGNRANDHPSNLRVCAAQHHRLDHGWIGLRRDDKRRSLRLAVGERQPMVSRLVMEIFLGRKLRREEIVLHRNGDYSDNRPSNLELVTRREWGRRMGRMYGQQAGEESRAKQRAKREGTDAGVAGGAGAREEVVRRRDAHGAAHSHETDGRAA